MYIILFTSLTDFLKKFIYFSNLYTHCGAQSHHPEIESYTSPAEPAGAP